MPGLIEPSGTPIAGGTAAFRAATLALACAGFTIFGLLYYVQPLLPAFSADFGVGAAQASFAVSVTTGVMAPAMLVASSVSEHVGRKPLMVLAILSSSGLTLAASLAPNWAVLLVLRALTGLSLACLPSIAMAYVAEEIATPALGLAMGLYIGGSALGGMAGRLGAGLLAELGSWRYASAGLGAMGLVAGLILWRSLPASRNFSKRSLSLRELVAGFAVNLRDPGLRLLVAEGFLLMGGFVSTYNYVGYRLLAPPYEMSQASVGMIFAVYILGLVSSPATGALSHRVGLGRLFAAMILVMGVGVALTLARPVAIIVLGLALLTFGFFGAHSLGSAWVGRRARIAKAQAAALYLFLYYVGSSVLGSLGGLFWQNGGWDGVVTLVSLLFALAFVIALRLMQLKASPS